MPTTPTVPKGRAGIAPAARRAMRALCVLAAASMPAASADGQLRDLPLMQERGVGGAARMGLGVLVSDSGHLVTSHHVVEGCRTVRVAGQGQSQTLASLVGEDPNNDVAVYEFDDPALARRPRMRVRPYPPARAGEKVYFVSIGREWRGIPAPVPLRPAAVIGQRGAQRDVRLFTIRTDVLGSTQGVRPGDSGGPVLDEYGNLVGIVTGSVPYGVGADLSALSHVSFSLGAALVAMLLSAEKIAFDVTTTRGRMLDEGEVRDIARRLTVRIWCTPSTR